MTGQSCQIIDSFLAESRQLVALLTGMSRQIISFHQETFAYF